jgi:tetratricopeptide (TPR) repeat protein
MRATLQDASLARYAGRFVWLELDYDKPVNQAFIGEHGVTYTPTMLIVDPKSGQVKATQLGGMTLAELQAFLDRNDHGGSSRAAEIATRTWNLMLHRDYQSCAAVAAAEAPRMLRDEAFARVVLAGLSCANSNGKPAKELEKLAAEAAAVPAVLRDHRFQLFQQLMVAALMREDVAALHRRGDRWLAELDTTRASSDDERSALDIARVDAASLLEQPERVLPALIASEKAMPDNYNASLRLAQVADDAKRYDLAIAACDRGLLHVTGPLGRSWLLHTKADVLEHQGNAAGARRALEEAIASARRIGNHQLRDRNVEKLSKALSNLGRNNDDRKPQ